MTLPLLRAAQEGAVPIVGIDLGTTFSLAAHMSAGVPVMVRGDDGDARIPSALLFEKSGGVLVGRAARERAVADPTHVVYSVKRLIGRTLADLADDLKYIPFQVVERKWADGRKVLHVLIDGLEHTPEELSAMILREVAEKASAAIGRKVERVVITVPAYFDESQRQATRDAGRIAGLDVVRIINEPTAAALAYGLQERTRGAVAVYDLGGGTFDCSILRIDDGVFKVLSTHGDTHLGGDDVDIALVDQFAGDFAASVRENHPHDSGGHENEQGVTPAERQALRDAAERLKIELSEKEAAYLVVKVGDFEYRREYTRLEFERTIGPIVERTMVSCKAALRDAGLDASDVDEVVLVGGSSRIPLVRRRVAELFNQEPHCEINPDEVVALGAAVQAGVLAGQLKNVLLLDVTPLSLGIETIGGAVSKLIPRNSTIPFRKTEQFSTYVDGQTSVDFQVLQGERELAKDCRSLGRFRLDGLPPMPAGIPRIEVTFLLDVSGMLQVTAVEKRSGKAAAIDVSPSQGLSRQEVEAMITESVARAREDFSARRLVDLQTKADADLRHTQKALASLASIGPELRSTVEAAIQAVEKIRLGADADLLQKSLDELDRATRPLADLQLKSVLEDALTARQREHSQREHN